MISLCIDDHHWDQMLRDGENLPSSIYAFVYECIDARSLKAIVVRYKCEREKRKKSWACYWRWWQIPNSLTFSPFFHVSSEVLDRHFYSSNIVFKHEQSSKVWKLIDKTNNNNRDSQQIKMRRICHFVKNIIFYTVFLKILSW